jgi:hypothetical protein
VARGRLVVPASAAGASFLGDEADDEAGRPQPVPTGVEAAGWGRVSPGVPPHGAAALGGWAGGPHS